MKNYTHKGMEFPAAFNKAHSNYYNQGEIYMSNFTKPTQLGRLTFLAACSAILIVGINNTRVLSTPGTSIHTRNSQQYALNSFDQQFVTKVAQGNLIEVELAKLALQKSSQNEVKQFAQRMINDHTQAYNYLKQFASKKGIKFPEGINNQDKALIKDLSQLSGTNFDQKYMNQMLQAHKATKSLFEQEIQEGQDSDLKTWAKQTITTVEEHLQMASSIINNSQDAKK
ncbi:DUF4142 domain-containing protein [Calothrix sp. FACHB-156]|uniref:DUF4142 domain-containing protein n=1 Tax=Calothrix sp. NIES-2100 TaxID=1954172 RepID=UPI000BBC30C5|nr:DUF4142 domain-containing protein [Nostoc linckia FACHB-104]MBD2340771.1 DUF4142 domain-containing protein [Calothrix sp. FACHB-156]